MVHTTMFQLIADKFALVDSGEFRQQRALYPVGPMTKLGGPHRL